MIYLSGAIGEPCLRQRHERLGFIVTPDMGNSIPDDVIAAADNGCFANPANYSDDRYEDFLRRRFIGRACLFAVAADVYTDHAATVARSLPMLRRIRALGLPAAFVAQDGWQESTTPWDEFDVLFVGGSTAFKFRAGRHAVAAALKRNKRTHMGRVNSLERLRASKSIGCHSADGTYLKFGPDVNLPKLLHWLRQLEHQHELSLG